MIPTTKHRADAGPRVTFRVSSRSAYRRRIAQRLAIFTASHGSVAGLAVAIATLAG